MRAVPVKEIMTDGCQRWRRMAAAGASAQQQMRAVLC